MEQVFEIEISFLHPPTSHRLWLSITITMDAVFSEYCRC